MAWWRIVRRSYASVKFPAVFCRDLLGQKGWEGMPEARGRPLLRGSRPPGAHLEGSACVSEVNPPLSLPAFLN